MEQLVENSILNEILDFSIIEIPSTTRFWMIRTKRGYFYNDFIYNKYIALGWNLITKQTDFNKQSLDTLKDLIKQNYNEKVPMTAINKCIKFINEIKNGDIIIIPSSGTRYITFAIAGDYYEDNSKTYDDEIIINNKIESNEQNIKDIECPYTKRRHINIIKTVKIDEINNALFKALISYHGISNLDAYHKGILDTMYNVYIYQDMCSVQVGVNTQESIKAVDISQLIYGLTHYMGLFVDEECLTVTLNLNSPGKISLSERMKRNNIKSVENVNKEVETSVFDEEIEKAKKVFNKVKKGKFIYLGLLIAVTGGKFGPLELPGVVKVLKDIKTLNYDIEERGLDIQNKGLDIVNKELEIKQNELDIEQNKLDLQKNELDIIQKKIELSVMLNEDGIDIDKLCSNLELILGVSDKLKLGIKDDIEIQDIDTSIDIINVLEIEENN